MVYFRCTSSGSGKGNTVIVTCAEQFAGVAITIAKIGKSYTKVCPLSAPYVVKFYGVEAGTYTVSATVSGQTYSAEVVVQDVSCVLDYGFNWKTWVDTASQLDSTDYASLSEVLADEEAVRELFTEHACVDYMADSTSSNADLETIIENDLCAKWINNSDYALDYLGANVVIKALMDTADKYGYGEWIITDDTTTPPTWGPKGNVPKMTANTAPYGEAIYSSQNSSYPAYQAFDGNDSTAFGPSSASVPQWIGYTSPTPICVKRVKIRPDANSTGSSVKDFIIQGSNDKSTWVDLYTDSLPSQTTATDHFIDVDGNDDYYLHHRVYITSKNGSWAGGVSVSSLQFYGRSLSVSVPTMTSNTAPYGEAIANETYDSGYEAFRAFDNSDSSRWAGRSTNVGVYCGYKFTTKMVFKKLFWKSAASIVGNYIIKGSNDGNTWTPIGSGFAVSGNSSGIVDYPNNATEYSMIALFSNGSNTNSSSFITLQFYGKDYSEKEFEVGTTKKWLYDHGVELESYSEVGTITVTHEDSDLLMVSNANALGILYTESAIDLTSHKVIRVKVGNIATDVTRCIIGSKHTKDNNTSSTAEASLTVGNAPYNEGLDISSVNQNDYPFIAPANQSNANTIAITEWWLE